MSAQVFLAKTVLFLIDGLRRLWHIFLANSFALIALAVYEIAMWIFPDHSHQVTCSFLLLFLLPSFIWACVYDQINKKGQKKQISLADEKIMFNRISMILDIFTTLFIYNLIIDWFTPSLIWPMIIIVFVLFFISVYLKYSSLVVDAVAAGAYYELKVSCLASVAVIIRLSILVSLFYIFAQFKVQ